MPEPTQRPIDTAQELATLRTVNAELLQKSAARKQRISELESTVTELQSKLSETNDSLRRVTIDGPLRAMAEELSTAPSLWIEQFSKSYRLEMLDGKLTMQTADGRPVLSGDKSVPFERQVLIQFLTSDTHPQAEAFKAITIVSRASGAGTINNERGRVSTQDAPKSLALQFGLR
jgi:hypothetical protein